MRELAVYTPPGYEQQADARFPTLYLQHGSGDNQATWVVHGKAHWILDNLIAQGKARPMVVVMMDGHAGDRSATGPQGNTGAFERDLLQDVMPFVEANYRVQDGCREPVHRRPEHGRRPVAHDRPESSGPVRAGWRASVPPFRRARPWPGRWTIRRPRTAGLKLLWIACGKDDFLLKRNEEFISLLKEKNIRHEWHLTDGNHSWPVWRIYLAELAPKLFQ